MNKQTVVILFLAFLSFGAVAEKRDPVRMTQTDPILYEEKAKEEAEGKKGPPAPAMELFPKEEFLSDDPSTTGDENLEIPEEEMIDEETIFDEGESPLEEEILNVDEETLNPEDELLEAPEETVDTGEDTEFLDELGEELIPEEVKPDEETDDIWEESTEDDPEPVLS